MFDGLFRATADTCTTFYAFCHIGRCTFVIHDLKHVTGAYICAASTPRTLFVVYLDSLLVCFVRWAHSKIHSCFRFGRKLIEIRPAGIKTFGKSGMQIC